MNTQQDNIIFVMPDEWRHDVLGVLDPAVHTPNLDALARRGTFYSNAYCDSPVCQPSRASIMTAQTVPHHGLADNEMSRFANGRTFPPPSKQTFLQALQGHGYHTAVVGKLNVVFPEWEFTKERRADGVPAPGDKSELRALFGTRDVREFEERGREYGIDTLWEEADKQSLVLHSSRYTDYLESKGLLADWREKVFTDSGDFLFGMLAGQEAPMYGDEGPMVAEHLQVEDTLDAFIGAQACRFVEGYDTDKPFFLWTCFAGPHPPFDAPGALAGQYRQPERACPGPADLFAEDNDWGRYVQWVRRRSGSEAIRADQRTQLLAQYYAGCTLIDEQVGHLVAMLEERGLAESTWIIFGSDHGELLGDYGLIQKRLFYRGSVQVPLIVVPPKGRAHPLAGGAVADDIVQNLDVSATVVNIAGGGPRLGDGRSLLSADRAAREPRINAESYISGFAMVCDGRYKLIFTVESREPQLVVDLFDDPVERTNLLGTPEGDAIAARFLMATAS